MPAFYSYAPDGKLHTRFSELRLCTPVGVKRIVDDRFAPSLDSSNRFQTFGTARHEVFANHLKKHSKLPKVFREQAVFVDINPEMVETTYAVEVDDVVIHFTPDFHNIDYVADFKTTGKGAKAYATDKQTLFYAWLLDKLGHNIKVGYYVCEQWDKARTKIEGYSIIKNNISKEDKLFIEYWAKNRIKILLNEIKRREDENA